MRDADAEQRRRNRERFVIDRIDTTRSANTLIREA
jgi:hypothetical protein